MITVREGVLDNEQVKSYTLPEQSMTKEGVNNLSLKAEDNASNTTERSYSFKLDKTAPTIGLELSETPVTAPNIYDKDINYTLHLKDTISGIKNATYQIDGGKILPIKGDFGEKIIGNVEQKGQLNVEGEHTIKVVLTDNAGNTTEATHTLILNRKAPSLSPQNGAKDVDVSTDISFKGDEALYKGDGYIRLYEKKTDKRVGELHSSNNRVTIKGDTVTLQYPEALDPNTDYYVRIGEDAFQDAGGTKTKAFGGKDQWHFRTKADGSKVKITGFNVDLIKRKNPESPVEIVQVAAVVSGENPKSYNILTTADYKGDDQEDYVKMTIRPNYSTEPSEIKITATNKKGEDVSRYITQNKDGSFDCTLPNSEEKVDIRITIGNDPNNAFNIVILNTDFKAEIITKGVEAKADKDSILNSVDLEAETKNKLVTDVNIVLNVEKQDNVPPGDETLIQTKINALLQEEKRPHTKTQRYDLEINMYKEVKSINAEEVSQPLQRTLIYNLQNLLSITIGIPEALRHDYTYQILRVHNGIVDSLELAVNAEGTEGTFETDRLSTYSLLAVPKQVKLGYTADEGGSIQGKTSQTIDIKQDGEAVEAVAKKGWHFVSWDDGTKRPPDKTKP